MGYSTEIYARAQKLLEQLSYPYLSIDHLKMGLIRAGQTALTPESGDAELTAYLWPVISEIIKTNIENGQNLIIEGCYIPFDFEDSLADVYLREIRYVCLIFSGHYIERHHDDIRRHAAVIERRDCDGRLSIAELTAANQRNLNMCQRYGLDYILIDGQYDIDRYVETVVGLLRRDARAKASVPTYFSATEDFNMVKDL